MSVEEYQSTINGVNAILLKSVPLNLKFLLCGCLCCVCTLGMSLGPVFYLNKRVRNLTGNLIALMQKTFFSFLQTRSKLDKLLKSENWRLYNKVC